MQYSIHDSRRRHEKREYTNDVALIHRFKDDPEGAYDELLERYSKMILRMIRRFMQDTDEVMEVYTAICERFRAKDYQALRRFRISGHLTPWLSVVVANACRDRFRKKRVTSVPNSVLSQLNKRECLVFKYYFQDHLPHEEIAQTISSKRGKPCTALDVARDIEKINDLLTIKKRWHLLAALNVNRSVLSIDELREVGYQPVSTDGLETIDERWAQRRLTQRLNEAMAQLQPQDQLLVLLRYEHGMRATQIARVMNYESHKYVYTRLRTIVNRLRRMMAEPE